MEPDEDLDSRLGGSYKPKEDAKAKVYTWIGEVASQSMLKSKGVARVHTCEYVRTQKCVRCKRVITVSIRKWKVDTDMMVVDIPCACEM